MNGFQLYFRLIHISLLSRMQYRANFIIGILGLVFWNVINLGLIGVMVTQFTSLNNWTLWELVFLYCLWIAGHSLYSLFFSQSTQMEDYLLEGTFDQFLIRPASPLIQLLGRELQYIEIADLLIGLTGLSLAYTHLGLHWEGWQWSFFVIAIISGAVIELAMNLLIASSAFWVGRARGSFFIAQQFYGLVHQYPIDIFGKAFRVFVTGFLPVAFMNYYPALLLLGKQAQLGSARWLSYLSPLVALVLVSLFLWVWELALQRYSSSGS
jgi:ABC-2 type transport system permease protein